MIKKTLYFGNPAYLSLKYGQIVINRPEINDGTEGAVEITRPIEDVGIVVIDNNRITITSGLLEALLENNCVIVTCAGNHMPTGLLLPLYGNTIQNERFRQQINASEPLKKQLWQQTIKCKISNQAHVLEECLNERHRCMHVWVNDVRSGDVDNVEARAAAYYWKNMYAAVEGFYRGRDGMPPNNLLNYGYAILRAVVARSLVANGLLPTLGIHHHNRYNAYCLADDIMEPYRPYVDKLVFELFRRHQADVGEKLELTRNVKSELLSIPTIDVNIKGKRRPLMVAVGETTASLFKCFSGELRKISYPEY